jgi:hypothetical protein
MPEKFWSHKQDLLCTAQFKELNEQISALSNVVGELTELNGKLQEALETRTKVMDDDLSAMESRLTTRLEGVEDSVAALGDYSKDDGETSAGGFDKWSSRKAKARLAASDPSVFTKPRTKEVKEP